MQIGDARLPARFWAMVEVSGACWNWTGTCASGPQIRWGKKVRAAHHVAWEALHARPKPPGLDGRRGCGNPKCVRPTHVVWAPADSPTRPGLKTECPNGHGPYSEETAFLAIGRLKPDGTRRKSAWKCKTCHRAHVARYLAGLSPRKLAARLKQRRGYFRARYAAMRASPSP